VYKNLPSRGSSTFRAVGTGLSKKFSIGFYFQYFHGKKGVRASGGTGGEE
jgi:hypothetical protein